MGAPNQAFIQEPAPPACCLGEITHCESLFRRAVPNRADQFKHFFVLIARSLSERSDSLVLSSSTPRSVKARRQRVTHLQPSTGQPRLHVRFRETEGLCSFVDTEV